MDELLDLCDGSLSTVSAEKVTRREPEEREDEFDNLSGSNRDLSVSFCVQYLAGDPGDVRRCGSASSSSLSTSKWRPLAALFFSQKSRTSQKPRDNELGPLLRRSSANPLLLNARETVAIV